jgi:hypothetical protein
MKNQIFWQMRQSNNMLIDYFEARKEKRLLVISQRWEEAHDMRQREWELANILVRSIAPTTAALNAPLDDEGESHKYCQDAIIEYCEGLYGTRDEDAIIRAIKLEDLGI